MTKRTIRRTLCGLFHWATGRCDRRDAVRTRISAERLESRTMLASGLEALMIFGALSRGSDRYWASLESAEGGSVGGAPAALSAEDGAAAEDGAGAAAADVSMSRVVQSEVEQGSNLPYSGLAAQPINVGLQASAATAEGAPGDIEIVIGDGVQVVYNANTGEIRTESSVGITTLEIISKSQIFVNASRAVNLGGQFDVKRADKLFKLDSNGFFNVSFGNVAQTGLSESFIREDVSINGSPLGGGVLSSSSQASARVEVVNARGNPTSTVKVGDELQLRVFVQDDRTQATNARFGVVSGYVDVEYDANLLEVTGPIVHGDQFPVNRSGSTVRAGLIDEVGGRSHSLSANVEERVSLGRAELLLATIPMRAKAEGTVTLAANPADELPTHTFQVFTASPNSPAVNIPSVLIEFEPMTLQVQPGDPDLVAFAKALADAGAKFYGAGWDADSTAQKQLFQDGQRLLPFIEVTDSQRQPNQIARDNNITVYPTWVFQDGSRLEGPQTLQTLSQQAGVSIPTSRAPQLAPISDVTLLGGSPLHIPLDGYDPNGDALVYTVTSDNPSLVDTFIPAGNRSMRISVEGFGDMVFQLFEDRAPRVTERIIQLAEDEFYDGLTFHRIINQFVIQGGDPRGDGTGGSDLPDFDDQFHVTLQHNRTGVLSMAKSTDDTNNSQFFITEGPQRHLDFNHSIFGQLIEGESNRDNISNTATRAGGLPITPVVMDFVEIFTDTENSLVMLEAPEGATGSANVTITVSDQDGNTTSQTFRVNVQPDDRNGAPFLEDVGPFTTNANTPLTFPLPGVDVEGDPIVYDASLVSNQPGADVEVDSETGEVTVTPPPDFVGMLTIRAEVSQDPDIPIDTTDPTDSQLITISVRGDIPTVDLLAATDSGASDSDDVTSVTELQFEVRPVEVGALVELFAEGTKIGEATATDNRVIITTSNLSAMGDGEYAITAISTVDGVPSEESDPLFVMLDQTRPIELPAIPSEATEQQLFEFDVDHPEEGELGFVYSVENAPLGLTIDSETGLLQWTPTREQTGSQTFNLVATDLAGNARTQPVTITVASVDLMRFRLEVTDLDGNAIRSILVGNDFLLKAHVRDLRTDLPETLKGGVFAAFLDVEYDPALVSVAGPLTYGDDFPNNRIPNTTATPGLLDEAGAVANLTPTGPDERLLWTLRLSADSGGVVTFAGNAPDQKPQHDNLLFDLDTPVPDEDIDFGSTSLTIVGTILAEDDTVELDEDSPEFEIDVLVNDLVAAGVTATITDFSPAANGQVTIAADGLRILYTPNANFNGTDTFTYTVSGDQENTSTANVAVTVRPVNDDPTAVDDTLTVDENADDFPLDVLANDSSAPDEGEVLSIQDVGDPQHGSVVVSTDRQRLLYTPDENFVGTDGFTYTITDGRGGTATATATVNVTAVNRPPVAVADSVTTDEDTELAINVSDLLANDNPGVDETGQTLTVTQVGAASVGTVVLAGNQITYTPAADFNGTATFTYTIEDDGTTRGQPDPKTATATVTVTVKPVNDNPTAVNDTATVRKNSVATSIDVLPNDTITPDVGETLTISSVGAPSSGGTATIANGKIEYTPAADFAGTDTFTYTISDGNGGTATATVTVTVTDVVPGQIQGKVFFDANNNGQQDAAETALGGVAIQLLGTTRDGQAVTLATNTNSEGSYSFANLQPGTYRVVQVQPMFTMQGKEVTVGDVGQASALNEFTIEVTDAGVPETSQLNFSERGAHPRFSIYGALANTPREGFLAAVDATDGYLWSDLNGAWSNYEVVDLVFSQDQSQLTLTVRDPADALVRATISRSDRSRIRVLGREGDSHLIRLAGRPADYQFQPAPAAAVDAAFAGG